MYCIIQGDSDLDLYDEENAKIEVAPAGVERESSEEEPGGSSHELTDTDEQENHHLLWTKTSMYDRSIDREIIYIERERYWSPTQCFSQ